MEMDSGDDVLRNLASGGSMDYAQWPDLLSSVVSRIQKIAIDDFPVPVLPPPRRISPRPEPRLLPPLPSSDPAGAPTANSDSTSSSQETNKENTNPAPPAPARQRSPASPPAAEADGRGDEPRALPPPVVALMEDIAATLETSFPRYPPHTVQRLAELVLFPRQHYRSLPAFLHALDRVVHVTSGADLYPLPPAVSDMSVMARGGVRRGEAWTNGAPASPPSALGLGSSAANVGSDEALGGALLTPIPWLQARQADTASPPAAPSADGDSPPPEAPDAAQQTPGRRMEGQVRTESTETIDGPNGVGHIETVSISLNGVPSHGAVAALQHQQQQLAQQQAARGVTQGELLRQEQRAGVVPVSQLARSAALSAAEDGAADGGPDSEPGAEHDASDEDEVPHARGPEEIGPADTGPQTGAPPPGLAGHAAAGVEMQAIDVAAAVGRRPAAAPRQLPLKESGAAARAAPAATTDDDDADEDREEQRRRARRASTPKREADDALDGEAPSKKRRASADAADTEGDIVLTDRAGGAEAAAATEAAEAAGADEKAGEV